MVRTFTDGTTTLRVYRHRMYASLIKPAWVLAHPKEDRALAFKKRRDIDRRLADLQAKGIKAGLHWRDPEGTWPIYVRLPSSRWRLCES